VIEGMWLDPLVQRRWQRLALRLSEADCKRIGRLAAERGLASSGIRWLGTDAATEGWELESAGYATDDVGRTSVEEASERLASTPLAARRHLGVRLASRPAQLALAISHE
jgi:hypothetical protein